MKWLVGMFALVCVATVVTVFYVVLNERDAVPDQLIECAEEAGARRIVRADSLGPLRVDLLAGELLEGDTVGLTNGYRIVFLRPTDGSYEAIVLQTPEQFDERPLAVIPDRPSTFPLVAYGRGEAAEKLVDCVDEERNEGGDAPGAPR